MTLLRRLVFWALAALAFIVALLAAVDNSNAVTLHFLRFESSAWPLSWWLLTAFLLGTLFGILLSFYSNLKLRLTAHAANRTAEKRRKALESAQAKPSAL